MDGCRDGWMDIWMMDDDEWMMDGWMVIDGWMDDG